MGHAIGGFTQREAALARRIEAPLAGIARHVVEPCLVHASTVSTHRREAAGEVAARQKEAGVIHVGRGVPVIDRRQPLADELRVRGGLVPAHAGDGVLGEAVGVGAQLPSGRAWTAGRVAELRRGLLPGNCPAILHERMLPEVAPAIATGVHELLELAVCHFVDIHPEAPRRHTEPPFVAGVIQKQKGRFAYPGHAWRRALALFRQPEGDLFLWLEQGERHHSRLALRMLDLECGIPARRQQRHARRAPQMDPFGVGTPNRARIHVRAGGCHGPDDAAGRVPQGSDKQRIIAEYRLGLPGEKERLPEILLPGEAPDLRNQGVARLPHARGVDPQPGRDRQERQQRHRRGHRDTRTPEERAQSHTAIGKTGLARCQRVGEFDRGCESAGGVLLQAPTDDAVDLRRNACANGACARRRRRQDGRQRRDW